jgi:hypothetical protein
LHGLLVDVRWLAVFDTKIVSYTPLDPVVLTSMMLLAACCLLIPKIFMASLEPSSRPLSDQQSVTC